jgi:hypothetical protein
LFDRPKPTAGCSASGRRRRRRKREEEEENKRRRRRRRRSVPLLTQITEKGKTIVNQLNAELNTVCHLLALLGAHHILHVSRIRVKWPLIYTALPPETVCEGTG